MVNILENSSKFGTKFFIPTEWVMDCKITDSMKHTIGIKVDINEH